MNRTIARFAAVAAASAGLALAGCSESSSSPHRPRDYGVTINPIAGLPEDFIKGADVSMLAQIEASGGAFHDEDGAREDCLEILRDHGVNWVRLRLWNDPVIAHDFDTDGRTITAGQSPGGVNDEARDLALALRAKALGMKVLLDFHYSDWWADPGKQWLPQAWERYTTLDEVKGALHDFTQGVIGRMVAAGAAPDMVQLGNEVRTGMMWGWGALDAGHDDFAALLSAASRAVRAVDPSIPIMIHLDKGASNGVYRSMFTALLDRGVDFDVIGLSYYPYWHGSMEDLRYNLDDISAYYHKPVVIAETAWPWTTEDADDEGNSYSGASAHRYGYLPTVQGQATFVRDLMELVAAVPDRMGLGVFYWEPDWIPVEGAGWYTDGGDGWDNQTMFDHAGKALPSLNVFRAVSEDRPEVAAAPVAVVPLDAITTTAGTAPTLPAGVLVAYSDDSVLEQHVIWDDVDGSAWDTAGTVEVTGAVTGTDLTVTQPVVVERLMVNLVANPGFEQGDTSGWTITTVASAGATRKVVTEATSSGTYAYEYWDSADFTFDMSQTVTVDTSGTYALSVYLMGVSTAPTLYMTCGSTTVASSTATVAGWGTWTRSAITGIVPTGTSCTVGLSVSAGAGSYAYIDDFALRAE